MRIINKIRRYFNPTFSEWLEDMNKGLEKEMENPRMAELMYKPYNHASVRDRK